MSGYIGMILFSFSEIFLQIKIFSIKIVSQIYISCHKMNQLCVPNRLKAIKRRTFDPKVPLTTKEPR